jgi:molybdenum cofactor cytidylyltransferase
LDVVILAGGKSSRFGKNKLSTLIYNRPLIFYTIKPFYDVGCNIILVTGKYEMCDMTNFFDKSRIHIVHNPNYELGMFTSVQTGVKEVSGPVFIIPGDMPFIQKSTIKTIMESKGAVRVPVYNRKRGHPLYVSQKVIKEIIEEPMESNLKIVRDRFTLTNVIVEDPGVLMDVDTVEDLAKEKIERMINFEI